MPTRDRKYYIHQYNEYMEEKARRYEGSGGSSANIDAATDMAQNDLDL
mgnify:FL=1|jgi:hypothetical protein